MTLLGIEVGGSSFGVFFFFGKYAGICFLALSALLSLSNSLFSDQTQQNWKEYRALADVKDHLYKIALTILISLKKLNLIDSNIPNINLIVEQHTDNHTFLLKGASSTDQATFLKALREVLNPVDNPRYLILKTIRYEEGQDLQMHYAVPQIMAKKKEDAEVFLENWNHFVGKARLIFTRKPSGRLQLLKARAEGLILGEPIKMHRSWR